MTASTVSPVPLAPGLEAQPAMRSKKGKNFGIGYLRAALTLLVVLHHATLAYYPLRPPTPVALVHNPRWWGAFPVVDKVQWSGFLYTVLFNDVFFMSLMFLISGLFVWKSLQHRGAVDFVRNRLLRLGVPFAIFAAIGPLAYYPTYLQSATHDGFWHEWLSLGNWPSGPVWFIWVLLAFDLAVAAIYSTVPSVVVKGSAAFARMKSPVAVGAILFVLSSAAYLPMELHFGHDMWTGWGPFYFQECRIFLYFFYFLVGVAIGAAGIEKGLLQNDGRLARQWPLWLLAAPTCFLLQRGLLYLSHRHWAPGKWEIAMDLGFALSCVASSFACLSCFLHFVRKESRTLNSLDASAYGIYLIHYFFVSWVAYGLLSVQAPGWAKGWFVFVATVLLSWGSIATLRRSNLFARVL